MRRKPTEEEFSSYGADQFISHTGKEGLFDSYGGFSEFDNTPKGDKTIKSSGMFLVSSNSKPGVNCILCGQLVMPAMISKHMNKCREKMKQKKEPSALKRKSTTKSGLGDRNSKYSVSGEFKDSSYGDYGGFSVSKTGKSISFTLDNLKSEREENYEDDFEEFDETRGNDDDYNFDDFEI